MKNIADDTWQACLYSVKYNYRMKKGGNADGEKNKKAEKSDCGTYSASTWNRYSHSSNQNGYWEYHVSKGEGNLPNASITKSICEINMKKEIFKLVLSIIWLIIIVMGLFLIVL